VSSHRFGIKKNYKVQKDNLHLGIDLVCLASPASPHVADDLLLRANPL
jgi:hypothetical protein